MDYERVTYRLEGATTSKTMYLRNTSESTLMNAPVLLGSQVNKEGEPLDVNHVMELALIRKRTAMRMNNFYGELETAKE